jgi:DNA repair protein RadC
VIQVAASQSGTEYPKTTTSGTIPKAVARRLKTLRLVSEGPFNRPAGYPDETIPIRSPQDVYTRMRPYADRESVEVFWLLPLDARHNLINAAPVAISRGTLTSSLVHPREVFMNAIVARAAAVVVAHNHPSGDPSPSTDDRAVTEQLVAAGRLLDIPVHDHVVIGRDRYVSFAEAGLI